MTPRLLSCAKGVRIMPPVLMALASPKDQILVHRMRQPAVLVNARDYPQAHKIVTHWRAGLEPPASQPRCTACQSVSPSDADFPAGG